jgi:hypothetical protein
VPCFWLFLLTGDLFLEVVLLRDTVFFILVLINVPFDFLVII